MRIRAKQSRKEKSFKMYCIKCGVELKDSEKRCPLCGTPVFHPDIKQPEGDRPYPEFHPNDKKYNKRALMLVITVCCALPVLLTVLIDFRLNGAVTWSGFVFGGAAVIYTALILPWWFSRPNPVIFTPCAFAAIILYLWYIEYMTGGGWFLSFAFPVTAIAGLIVTAVITLTKYLRTGYLFIYGGAIIAVGVYTMLIELFLHITFDGIRFVMWSLYPLVACLVIGIMLIVIGANKNMREALKRKFFM